MQGTLPSGLGGVGGKIPGAERSMQRWRPSGRGGAGTAVSWHYLATRGTAAVSRLLDRVRSAKGEIEGPTADQV